MKSAYVAAGLAAVIAAGLVAPAAYSGVRAAAQETQMMHSANWGGHGHGGRGWGRHMDPAHVEGGIAFLQAELAITDDQQPQWQAFADALRQAAAEMRELRAMPADAEDDDNDDKQAMSAPERLDRMERFAATGLEAIRRAKEPLTALYAVLSDDQKARADRLLDHRRRR